jgi:hypothetical protein
MQDLVFVATIVAFFALMLVFVRACDLIIGSDEQALVDRAGGAPEPEPALEGKAA